MEIMLEDVVMAFPAIAEPQAIGDGDPAYGARFIIDPKNKKMVAALDKLMEDVAVEKWKDDGKEVLDLLKEDKKTAFVKGVYKNKKTGKPYDGFAGMYYVGARNACSQPTAFDEYGNELTGKAEIRSKLYSGCRVHAKIDVWAQDNQYGRKINATLLGVMFAGDGERFGGGSAPATADDFAGMAKEGAEASDVL